MRILLVHESGRVQRDFHGLREVLGGRGEEQRGYCGEMRSGDFDVEEVYGGAFRLLCTAARCGGGSDEAARGGREIG